MTILKVLKINFFSIITIVLFLVAFTSKLLEIIISELIIIKNVLISILVVIAVYQIIYYGFDLLESYLTFVVCFSICTIVSAMFSIIRNTIYFIIMSLIKLFTYLWTEAIYFFSYTYTLCYSSSLKLTALCERDFEFISLSRKKVINVLYCVFYFLSKGIRKSINIICYCGIIIAIVFSVLCSFSFGLLANKYFNKYYSENIIDLLKQHNNLSAIAEISICLIIIIGIFTLLILIGLDLHAWSKDLNKPTVLNSDINFNNYEETPIAQNEETYFKYNNMFYKSIEDIETLACEVQEIFNKDKDSEIIVFWNEYLLNVKEVCSAFNSFDKKGKAHRFEIQSLIPKIINIKNYHKNLIEQINDCKIRMVNQSSKAVFFSDCDTLDKLEHRHKILCKAYHPDAGGEEETFKKMQNEYESLKTKLNKNGK